MLNVWAPGTGVPAPPAERVLSRLGAARRRLNMWAPGTGVPAPPAERVLSRLGTARRRLNMWAPGTGVPAPPAERVLSRLGAARRRLSLTQPRHHGFSLIELMVVIALLALLMLAAIPAVGAWVANARVRSSAEVLQNDLRAAQQEALRRSRRTVLALTAASPDWNAAPAANGANWYVRAQPLSNSDEAASRDLSFVVGHQTGSQSGLAVSGPALLCFNSMGQLINVAAADTGLGIACAAGNPVVYTLSHPRADRSFQVRVYLGGRVQMCDAAKLQSAADPDGCPAS